jgi:hypothetical protein
VGVAISVLELACTGQVYAPTILFMLKTGRNTAGALSYLVFYNLAFVTPLIIIFILATLGLRSDGLTHFMHRHAALVKFCTAGLFFVLFLLFLFGDRLQALMQLGPSPGHSAGARVAQRPSPHATCPGRLPGLRKSASPLQSCSRPRKRQALTGTRMSMAVPLSR